MGRAPRFPFFYFSVTEKKRREGNSSGKGAKATAPDLEKSRTQDATTGADAHSRFEMRRLNWNANYGVLVGAERNFRWESAYDETAVELVLEVSADVGMGGEVGRHGGAPAVLCPPRASLVVVRRGGRRSP